jgi:phytoene dehydrogenase-like protein
MPTAAALPASAEAIVIGAGPNGLVAANQLADAGWHVVVLEAQPVAGGAVRTAELTLPGFHHDVFSAFFPFAVASPHLKALDLEAHGLNWMRAPISLGHPTLDGPSALLAMDRSVTHGSLEAFAEGDGARWRDAMAPWQKIGEPLIDALFTPFPPVRATVALARRLGTGGALELLRNAVMSVRRYGDERFVGHGARLFIAGLALHTDLGPEAPTSAFYGWILAALAEDVGFPVVEGGAQRLTEALVRRLESKGGQVICGARVERIVIEGGRATGVVVDGTKVGADRAVVADCGASALYVQLVGLDNLPARFRVDVRRFESASGTIKVDWALDGPIPWRDRVLNQAGTVHIANSMSELSEFAYHLSTGQLPSRPFLLIGQMTSVDPSRSPTGTETAWAYTHVPQQLLSDAAGELDPQWNEKTRELFADRMEQRIEDHAPGFRSRILARHIMAPPDFAGWDENLVGGDVNGGTAQLYQQLVFRPVPGLGRAETPIDRLYLASASAHPGGGVHGGPGANAARAALFRHQRAGSAVSLSRWLARGAVPESST